MKKDIIHLSESVTFSYEPKLYVNVCGSEYPLNENQVHKIFEGLFNGLNDHLSVREFRDKVKEEAGE